VKKERLFFGLRGTVFGAASLILFPPSKTCQLPTKSSNECKSLAPTFGGVLILKKAPNFIILWVIDRLHTHKNQLSKYCFSYLGIMRVIPSIERLIFIWQLSRDVSDKPSAKSSKSFSSSEIGSTSIVLR
jgi:hypothetical protein